jgi:hypothetical protein
MTMTTTCRTLSSNARPAHLHEAPITPSFGVIDLVPVHDRSRKESDEVIRQLEIEQEIRKAAAQRRRSIELYDSVEDWLYSLVPAAAIAALLIGVLGLLDSQTPRAQTTLTKKSSAIEQNLSSQSRDGKF